MGRKIFFFFKKLHFTKVRLLTGPSIEYPYSTARALQKVKNEDEPQMFALLLGSLDADSYDMVTNHENWAAHVVSKDCAAFLA